MTTRRGRLLGFCKVLLTKLSSGLRRFPETLIMCAATAVVLMVLNHWRPGAGHYPFDSLKQLAAVLALGIPLSLCIKVFFERTPSLKLTPKIIIYMSAAAGLFLYYLFLLKDFGTVSVLRYVATSLALYLAFTFIPYLYRRQNYEQYIIKLGISFLITYLFAAVLFGGLAAILATINYLFSARIPENTYLDIWLIVAGIFAPAFFLADIPEWDRELELESYPKVIGVLLSYILVPLILAYSVILYAYFLKVLLIRQWPEVMVSHLVLWYAILSTLVIFCIYPLRGTNRWIRAFTDQFPKLLLPLLALMFAAMGVRIGAYGITENRYFVLAAGLWVTGSMLYLIISRKPRNIFLPAALALVAVLSVYGPWSAFSVSVRSQNRRFEQIASGQNIIQNGKVVKPTTSLPENARKEISSIILYFDRNHKLSDLKALPEGFRIDQMEALLGFPLHEWTEPDDEESYFYYALDENEAYWDISDYDYLMRFSPEGQRYRADDLEVSYSSENHALRILRRGEEIYSRNVAEFVTELRKDNAGRIKEMLSREELTFLDTADGLRLLFGFAQLNGWENPNLGTVNLDYVEFYLFMSLDEKGD